MNRALHAGTRLSSGIILLLGAWSLGSIIFFSLTDSPLGGWGWSYRLSSNLCATRTFMVTFLTPIALSMAGSIATRTDTASLRSMIFSVTGIVSVAGWAITSHIILGTWQAHRGPRLTGALWAWVLFLFAWQGSLMLCHLHFCFIRAVDGGYLSMPVQYRPDDDSSAFYMMQVSPDEPDPNSGRSSSSYSDAEEEEEDEGKSDSLPVKQGPFDRRVVMCGMSEEDEFMNVGLDGITVDPRQPELNQRPSSNVARREGQAAIHETEHETIDDTSIMQRVDVRMQESVADQEYQQDLIHNLPPQYHVDISMWNAVRKFKFFLWGTCFGLQLIAMSLVIFSARSILRQGATFSDGFIQQQSFFEHFFWILVAVIWCSVLPDGPTTPLFPVAR